MRLLVSSLIVSCLMVASSSVAASIADDLQEVNMKFTYRGKPIHPGLVQEFASWMSDPGEPTTISVDVAAPHGNEYFEDDVVAGSDAVCRHEEGESEYFCYRWLGRLANGLHVLDVGEGGGGSGIFGHLFFVKFDLGQGYTREGKKYDRLLMSIVRTYGLGDRFSGDITLDGNTVNIKGKGLGGEIDEAVEVGE